MPTDFANFSEFLAALQSTVSTFKGGAGAAGAGGALMLALRLFRSGFIQAYLPEKLRWDSLPWYTKLALPFLASAAVSFLGTLGGGIAIPTAVATALTTALGAILLNHSTKAAGSVLTGALPKAAHKVVAPLFPIDPAKLPKFDLNVDKDDSAHD